MQRYIRSLIDAFRAEEDITLTVVGYGGGTFGLLFFFPWAIVRSLVFRGDRVHVGDALLSPILPILRLLRPGLRRSITVYGLDLTFPPAFYQWLIRSSLLFAECIVAISHATAVEAEKRGASHSALTVIPCGVVPLNVLRSSHSSSGHPRLLILGRQIPRKGTRWFVSEVFPRLLRAFPDIHLTIAGNGSELPLIRRCVDALHFRTHITLTGFVPENERMRLLLSSTLFVMPNVPVSGDMEGFGLVCIEAASVGLPVVAAELEGIADAVIPGETGIFFRPGDPKSAYEALAVALRRPWDPARVQTVCLEHFRMQQISSRILHDVFR